MRGQAKNSLFSSQETSGSTNRTSNVPSSSVNRGSIDPEKALEVPDFNEIRTLQEDGW